MLRKLSSIISCCVLFLNVALQVSAQNKAVRASASTEISDREKDGLLGPVRRVTVESAKVTFKNGSPVEGPRVLRAVMTYDPRGNKIDSLAYPVEGTSIPGKETYKYDDKGNIVEMELRGADGAILSKELYKYVLDELGNWKQMTTSLAVFEDGKLSDEPVEITYRTITYFYNQAIAKLTSTDTANKRKSSNNTASSTPVKAIKPTIMEAPALQPPPSNVDTSVQPKTEEVKNVSAASDSAPAKRSETPAKISEPPKDSTPLVKHVSEDILRKAAVSLPEPTYPDAAQLARVHGRVSVELLIDEQGNVTKARATSAQPMLNDAAEAAARSARFDPSILSAERAQVTGTINYDFVLPKPSVDSNAVASAEKKPDLPPANRATTGEKVSLVTAPSPATPNQPISEDPESSASYYRVGVSYLDAGKAIEAVEALNKSVYKDPENAGAYVKLGLAYMALQKPKEAAAAFKLAVRIKKDALDAEAYYQLGLAYVEIGKHADALSAFKQSLYVSRAESIEVDASKPTKVPTTEEIHYSLGLAYHNLGRFEAAVKELNQVIAINPKMAEAYYGLAISYISMGDRKSAEKQQKILSTLNPQLAERVSQALAPNRSLPAGLNDGILNRRRP